MRGSIALRGLMMACSLLLASCYRHNFPQVTAFPFAAAPTAPELRPARAFVDANGTFYPDHWREFGLPRSHWPAHSLLKEIGPDQAARARLAAEEARQLDALAAYVADKKRIFILVHGYNNDPVKAEAAYQDIVSRLQPAADDGVIWFGWDGLTASGAGPLKIWFNAAGYSQLAGTRGLRRILGVIDNKPITLISHSRGASVVLSALSNPVYAPAFLARTNMVLTGLGQPAADYTAPAALPARGNRLRIIMLAPAIDRIDFCDAVHQPENRAKYRCPTLRSLGSNVESLAYTVNSGDNVLNKYVGASAGFNPTGLGLRQTVGAEIAKRYNYMQAYVFARPQAEHGFRAYVAHPCFDVMLRAALAPGAPLAAAPINC